MKYKQFDQMNEKEGEAFINECKGNLFEYLVGVSISQMIKKEGSYLESFPEIMKSRFREYESFLRKNDLPLLKRLIEFSGKTAKKLTDYFIDIQEVRVVGKLNDSKLKREYKEADLLIYTTEKVTPISLKLSKKGAYVNTKSAGGKSFIAKYFAEFEDAQKLQENLNFRIEQYFREMGESLYENLGLSFPGSFDETWVEEGLSELPGELPLEMKEIVSLNYQKTNQEIYQIVMGLSEDRESFASSLVPLIGLGHEDMVQVICFNHRLSDGDYMLDEIIINDSNKQGKQLINFQIMPLNKKISSFEIKMNGFKLQIRVKPMNKFTTPSYKINCSVRYGEDNA